VDCKNRLSWEERLKERREKEDDFVLIIGGGQAGLGLGARLHLMDIPYRILEAGSQPGVAWRRRYPSLHLHDPVWYNHMPYLPFPESWPLLCPRDKIADWMELYAKVLDLNIQTNSRVLQVTKQEDGTWEFQITPVSQKQLEGCCVEPSWMTTECQNQSYLELCYVPKQLVRNGEAYFANCDEDPVLKASRNRQVSVSLSKQAGDKVAFSSRTVVSESRISILYCSLQKNPEFNSTTSATLKEIMECFINIVISTDSRQDVAMIHSDERYQEDDVIER
jgi:hypothetical protein